MTQKLDLTVATFKTMHEAMWSAVAIKDACAAYMQKIASIPEPYRTTAILEVRHEMQSWLTVSSEGTDTPQRTDPIDDIVALAVNNINAYNPLC